MKMIRVSAWLLVVMAGIGLVGCGRKSSSTAVLPRILTKWKQGDKNGAIEQFVGTDWSARPLFDPASPMSLSEKQFQALSTADASSKLNDLMPQIKDLRELANGVIQAGKDAAKNQDKAKAKKYFTAVSQYGAAIDSPETLLIVQLVGRAIKKIGDEELAK